jgi:hypothetical protein
MSNISINELGYYEVPYKKLVITSEYGEGLRGKTQIIVDGVDYSQKTGFVEFNFKHNAEICEHPCITIRKSTMFIPENPQN